MKSTLGKLQVEQKIARKLGLKAKTQMSPVLEKCCLTLCANESYGKAEKTIALLTGIEVSHSNQHRLVQRVEIPAKTSNQVVRALSGDGGKIRIRSASLGGGEWRDYKAVSLHGGQCAAYFQDNEAVIEWVNQQRLSRVVTCIGDGHDGIWKIMAKIGTEEGRREILDWYHLVENLYKIGGSIKRLERVKGYLWQGEIEEGLAELEGCRGKKVVNFRAYVEKHRSRIVDYQLHQELGIEIGSGSVESTVKQIGARVKIAGAQWKQENVAQILRLRCAYLNQDISLSISA